MSQININNPSQVNQLNVQGLTNDVNTNQNLSSGVNLPPALNVAIATQLMSLPSLQSPNGGVDSAKVKALSSIMAGLSLEVLVEALGGEERRVATKSGVDNIAARSKERKEVNDKQLQEMKENLDKMSSKKVLDGFLKALKWIGMIIGALAGAVITVVGAATANPALIAAGAIMIAMTVNSIVSEATDGKVSIGAGIAKLAEKCGASPEAAKWIGFGFEMAINIVAIGLSFGGAAAGSASTIATQTVDKVAQIAGTIAKVSAFANAGTSIVAGGVAIGNAVLEYNTALSRSEMKKLEAILQKLSIAIETETDFLQVMMEKSEKLMQVVGDIVQANAETNTAILAGAPPAMA